MGVGITVGGNGMPYFFPHSSIVTNKAEPMKIEEYVPAAIPTIRTSEKCSVVEPPTK